MEKLRLSLILLTTLVFIGGPVRYRRDTYWVVIGMLSFSIFPAAFIIY